MPTGRKPGDTLGCDAPFFVFCSASCGSTLLSAILDRHPELAIGPETYLLNKDVLYEHTLETLRRRMPRYLRRGRVSKGQVMVREFFFNREAYFHDQGSILAHLDNAETLREFIDDIFYGYAVRRGKSVWGEKTGSNGYFGWELLSIYPRARLIHLVRDPLDAISSIEKRCNSAFEAVTHYVYNHAAALRFAGEPGYLRVKYEDLVTSPEVEVARIAEHIGVEMTPRMLDSRGIAGEYWGARVDSLKNQHESWTSSLSDAINTTSVGKGRERYGPEMLRMTVSVALSKYGRRLLRLGPGQAADFNGVVRGVGYEPLTCEGRNIRPEIGRDWVKRCRRRLLCGQLPDQALFRSLA